MWLKSQTVRKLPLPSLEPGRSLVAFTLSTEDPADPMGMRAVFTVGISDARSGTGGLTVSASGLGKGAGLGIAAGKGAFIGLAATCVGGASVFAPALAMIAGAPVVGVGSPPPPPQAARPPAKSTDNAVHRCAAGRTNLELIMK